MNNGDRPIELSRTKVLLLVIGALAFVALGIWMFQLDPAWIEAQRRFNSPPLVHGIGLASVVFFGLCGVFGVRKLFDKRPGLVLSPAGMLDNSSGASAGLIPWADIRGFGVLEIQKQRMLIVELADPEKYTQSGGSMRRALNRMNLKMCGSPVAITSSSLKIRFDELLNLCQAYHAKYAGEKGDGGS